MNEQGARSEQAIAACRRLILVGTTGSLGAIPGEAICAAPGTSEARRTPVVAAAIPRTTQAVLGLLESEQAT